MKKIKRFWKYLFEKIINPETPEKVLYIFDFGLKRPIYPILVKMIYILGFYIGLVVILSSLYLALDLIWWQADIYSPPNRYIGFKNVIYCIIDFTEKTIPKTYSYLLYTPLGLIYILFLNRLFCEILILPFNIYNKLKSIDEKLSKEMKK